MAGLEMNEAAQRIFEELQAQDAERRRTMVPVSPEQIKEEIETAIAEAEAAIRVTKSN